MKIIQEYLLYNDRGELQKVVELETGDLFFFLGRPDRYEPLEKSKFDRLKTHTEWRLNKNKKPKEDNKIDG